MATPRPTQRRRGQGTVEFAMMIPVLFALLFIGMEFALWFGAIHWNNYAAFAAARANQVGDNGELAASLLLDGNMTRPNRVEMESHAATVSQWWRADLVGTALLMGNMNFQLTAVLGPEEFGYEGFLNPTYADNNGGGIP